MKRYFLMNYEAVQNLDGIENLNETDVVILLFMDDSKGVSFRTLAKMNASKAEIQQKFVNGKNETDMCYAVAFLVGQISSKGDEMILIGKSSDFSLFLKTFTEDANINLSDYESIEQYLENQPKQVKEPETGVRETIEQYLENQPEQVKEPETGVRETVEEKSEIPVITTDIIDKNLPVVPLLKLILNQIELARRTTMNEERTRVLNNYFWVVRNKPESASDVAVMVSQRLGFSVGKLETYAHWYRAMLKENGIS